MILKDCFIILFFNIVPFFASALHFYYLLYRAFLALKSCPKCMVNTDWWCPHGSEIVYRYCDEQKLC